MTFAFESEVTVEIDVECDNCGTSLRFSCKQSGTCFQVSVPICNACLARNVEEETSAAARSAYAEGYDRAIQDLTPVEPEVIDVPPNNRKILT